METHPYFWRSRGHSERHAPVTKEIAEAVVGNPANWEDEPAQEGGTRYYGYSEDLGKWVRVIVLADGRLFNGFEDDAAKSRVWRKRRRPERG